MNKEQLLIKERNKRKKEIAEAQKIFEEEKLKWEVEHEKMIAANKEKIKREIAEDKAQKDAAKKDAHFLKNKFKKTF